MGDNLEYKSYVGTILWSIGGAAIAVILLAIAGDGMFNFWEYLLPCYVGASFAAMMYLGGFPRRAFLTITSWGRGLVRNAFHLIGLGTLFTSILAIVWSILVFIFSFYVIVFGLLVGIVTSCVCYPFGIISLIKAHRY